LIITSKATHLSAGAIDEENNETGEIIPGRWRTETRVLRGLEKYGGHRTTKLAKKCGIALKRTSALRTLFPGNMKPLLAPQVTRTKLYYDQ
jgi:hypothetical protein